jgi:hypothetical protein
MDPAGKHDTGVEAAPRVRVGRSSREASRAWMQAVARRGSRGCREAELEGGGGVEVISLAAESEGETKEREILEREERRGSGSGELETGMRTREQ